MTPRTAFPAAILALAAACGGAAPETPAPAPGPSPAVPGGPATPLLSARVNGTLLHYRLAGTTGTPVVFVHGSLGDVGDWTPQLGAFARAHRVLVYSRRYHPPNPRQDDGRVYSPMLHAEDLAALLQALALAPAHVVGSSYGAYVALLLALEHPDLVRSLVLAEPPVIPFLYRTDEGDALRRAFFTTALEPARAAFRRGDSVEAVRRFLGGVSGSRGRFDSLPSPARAALLADAFELRRELLADPQQYMPDISCAALGRLPRAVLLLQGERSPRMFHVINEQLARCLQTETVITVPGAGHEVEAGNPAYYNQTVLQYIATH